MFQTWDKSQLLRRVLWINAQLTNVWHLKHKISQPIYIFNRENSQNPESPSGTRRGLDFIALHTQTYFKHASMNLILCKFDVKYPVTTATRKLLSGQLNKTRQKFASLPPVFFLLLLIFQYLFFLKFTKEWNSKTMNSTDPNYL